MVTVQYIKIQVGTVGTENKKRYLHIFFKNV